MSERTATAKIIIIKIEQIRTYVDKYVSNN